MLKKCYRLKKNTAFTATYKQKKIVADNFLVIYKGKEKTDNAIFTKYAFVVSKKYHKRAVKRNRIKRLMREVIRLGIKNKEFENVDRYQSFILLPKPTCLNASFEDINTSIHNLFEKI